MTALLTLSDLEAALGRPLTETEEIRAEYYIDRVSTYIETYTGISFSVIEDDVVRYQADYYGEIELGGGPILDVTSVTFWRSGEPVTYWIHDGLNKIINLQALQTVDVTYSHGYAVVPADIKLVAVEAVQSAMSLGITDGPVKSFTVGDVSETYAQPSAGSGLDITFSKSALSAYTTEEETWRLGTGLWPDEGPFP